MKSKKTKQTKLIKNKPKGFMLILIPTIFLILIAENYLKENIIYVLPILSMIDLSMTYMFLSAYQRSVPKDKDWASYEQNGVAKWLWRKLGFKFGTFMLGVIAMLFWLAFIRINLAIISYGKNFDSFSVGVFLGIYVMVIATHVMNFRFLRAGGFNR